MEAVAETLVSETAARQLFRGNCQSSALYGVVGSSRSGWVAILVSPVWLGAVVVCGMSARMTTYSTGTWVSGLVMSEDDDPLDSCRWRPRKRPAVVTQFVTHLVAEGRTEPPRDSWRLRLVRGWSHDTTRQVSTRAAGAGRQAGG